jgi:ABC-2 type transport system permease protein
LFATVAKFTPMYGLASVARAPLTGEGLTLTAVANLALWCTIFVTGAALLFRRDTRRP